MKKFVVFIACVFVFTCSALCFAACSSDSDVIEFYMPDGAPALSATYLMSGEADVGDYNINYNVVDSSTINTYVTGNNPKADVCILPVNAACQYLGDGEMYTLLGTVTHGNLFLVSKDSSAADVTSDNLEELVGKNIGVVNLNAVPGLTFRVILNASGISCNIVGNDGAIEENSVNLFAIDSPADLMASDVYDYGVIPEPAMSLQVNRGNLFRKGSLQEMYGGDNGYPQAVMVVKNSLIEEDAEFISLLIEGMKEGSEWVAETDVLVVYQAYEKNLVNGLAPTFDADNLTEEVIENCAINFVDAVDCKDEIIEFLSGYNEINGVDYDTVDEFFYNA